MPAISTTDKTNVDEVLEAIVGNRVGDLYPAFASQRGSGRRCRHGRGPALRRMAAWRRFHDPRGTITGVHGLIGSGVEMIGRALFGGVPRAKATTRDDRRQAVSDQQLPAGGASRARARRCRAQTRGHHLHAEPARKHVGLEPAPLHQWPDRRAQGGEPPPPANGSGGSPSARATPNSRSARSRAATSRRSAWRAGCSAISRC